MSKTSKCSLITKANTVLGTQEWSSLLPANKAVPSIGSWSWRLSFQVYWEVSHIWEKAFDLTEVSQGL